MANIYYEGVVYGNISKKKAKNSQRRFKKNINDGYSSHAEIASGNIVSYH